MIIFSSKSSRDIHFLQRDNSLYVCDFRACGEGLDYEIPAMWKYENLLQWICHDVSVVINGEYLHKDNEGKNDYQYAPIGDKASISVFERMSTLHPENIISVIPHPAGDVLANKIGVKIQYSYADFLKRNDKLWQKELLGSFAPVWEECQMTGNFSELCQKYIGGYLKRQHGSGGYTVFKISELGLEQEKLSRLSLEGGAWFLEKYVEGVSMSIQCYIDDDSQDIVVFGLAKQIIGNDKYFEGAEIIPLELLSGSPKGQLVEALMRLSPILEDYVGFFGVDFILDQDHVHVLEVNVRLTAVTVPTLICNDHDLGFALYEEDATKKKSNKGRKSLLLAKSSHSGKTDYLSWKT